LTFYKKYDKLFESGGVNFLAGVGICAALVATPLGVLSPQFFRGPILRKPFDVQYLTRKLK
jgi:hypothetical protein